MTTKRRMGHFGFGLLLVAGCSDDNGEAATPAVEDVSIRFEARINGEALGCGETYQDVGTPPAEYTVSDARFYVHDIELLTMSGRAVPVELTVGEFQSSRLALLDFEDGCGSDGTDAVHTEITGRAPAGDYSGVRFVLGVPAAENFVDLAAAEPPLDVTGMFWIWQFGYKYLKLDGTNPLSGGEPSPFFVHLGASECPGDNPEAPPSGDCDAPHLVTVELDGFSSAQSIVVADFGRLLQESDVSFNTEDTAPGCMSETDDPECQVILPRLGVGGAGQELFEVE